MADQKEDETLSSLELLWRHAFHELDEWGKRSDFRDQVFLNGAIQFTGSIRRNQENIKEVAEQFGREFAKWEKTARDEFLMSTTALQHFFPIRSYEDINAQIDLIQKRTLSILGTPSQAFANLQAIDKYLEIINQYIAVRKKGREQYIEAVKQAGNLIYQSQKGFVNLFAKQMNAFIFPLNKYLEKPEELTNS